MGKFRQIFTELLAQGMSKFSFSLTFILFVYRKHYSLQRDMTKHQYIQMGSRRKSFDFFKSVSQTIVHISTTNL